MWTIRYLPFYCTVTVENVAMDVLYLNSAMINHLYHIRKTILIGDIRIPRLDFFYFLRSEHIGTYIIRLVLLYK